MRLLLSTVLAAASVASAVAAPPGVEGRELVALDADAYVDPAATADEVAQLRRERAGARAALASAIGALVSAPPLEIYCKTSACVLLFAGPSRRSRALGPGDSPSGAHAWRDAPQSCQVEAQQVATLAGDDGVQLVEHDAAQIGEQRERVRRGEQERHLLRGRQQDVRRAFALALALGDRGVAGARLDRHAEPEVGHRPAEVALDVDRQRLQGRDIERVEAAPVAGLLRQFDKARQEAGERLAGAGRRDEQRVLAGLRGSEQLQLVRPRLPAAGREPGQEARRQRGLHRVGSRHHRSLARGRPASHRRGITAIDAPSRTTIPFGFKGSSRARENRDPCGGEGLLTMSATDAVVSLDGTDQLSAWRVGRPRPVEWSFKK